MTVPVLIPKSYQSIPFLSGMLPLPVLALFDVGFSSGCRSAGLHHIQGSCENSVRDKSTYNRRYNKRMLITKLLP